MQRKSLMILNNDSDTKCKNATERQDRMAILRTMNIDNN